MWHFVRSIVVALICIGAMVATAGVSSQTDTDLPIRGFCIAAPAPDGVDSFIAFIKDELVPAGVNTLVLRIDFRYEFTSHPELRAEGALSKTDITKLLGACRAAEIRLIPQINLLGHQSWAEKTGKLLEVYPEFDETPWVEMPEVHEWPNPDGLYCKSYCPLHPEVHEVVFALVDEILAVFDADAFHAGMDEVFYLADKRCPRCSGSDPAEVFAGEVRRIRDHLATRHAELWIWGDRLIDGRTTGLGMWEASMNNTHRAIDLIPKDVVICDWHYERPDPTAVFFAMKGFSVMSCSWNRAEVVTAQIDNMRRLRSKSTPEMSERFAGVMHTVWSPSADFINQFYSRQPADTERGDPIGCTKVFLEEISGGD